MTRISLYRVIVIGQDLMGSLSTSITEKYRGRYIKCQLLYCVLITYIWILLQNSDDFQNSKIKLKFQTFGRISMLSTIWRKHEQIHYQSRCNFLRIRRLEQMCSYRNNIASHIQRQDLVLLIFKIMM